MLTAVLKVPVEAGNRHQIQRPVRSPPRCKRSFDVVAAAALILVFLPLIVVVAVAVKVHDGGPVLFRQNRLGRGGATFRIAKFRSMATDAEARLHADPDLHARYVAGNFKLHPSEDPRINRLGRFLRASSLDELPQLFNVVAGHMSLVGPRPIVHSELAEYEVRGAASSYLAATPGLTGLWQVSGRSSLRYADRVDLDVAYVEHCSLRNDLKILVRTPAAVLQRSGAF